MSAIIRCVALRRLASTATITSNGNKALIPANNRSIKTSAKKDDTVTGSAVLKPPVAPLTKDDFANPNPENWVSYGFHYDNKAEDRFVTNASLFLAITCCVVVGGFVWAYGPDLQMRDWAQREAFLELRRREAAGEELINPNYVDPGTMILPDDEELGDREIII